MFAHIARERLMGPADLQACLLPTILRNVNKEKSEQVCACVRCAVLPSQQQVPAEATQLQLCAVVVRLVHGNTHLQALDGTKYKHAYVHLQTCAVQMCPAVC